MTQSKSNDASPEPFRSYDVPREHLTSFVDPPTSQASFALEHNLERIAAWDCSIGARSIANLRSRGRAELIAEARRYTASYQNLPGPESSGDAKELPILLAGHQPDLFHAGVWFKNFALSALGERLSAWAINLIIDNDTCDERSIRVPTMRDGRPAIDVLPFDQPSPVVPYEMATINDRRTFDCFADQVTTSVAPFLNDPCVNDLWPAARDAADRNSDQLGLSIAQSRHHLETAVGLRTLEVPLSRLCECESFNVFAQHLIDNLPQFHKCYNESVLEYRLAHRIRSHSHPVPQLADNAGWLEAPFWVYGDHDPHRRPLFVRQDQVETHFSDMKQTKWSISKSDSLAYDLRSLAESRGVRIRPRALTTTMYARLVLSDYFLHGIGGGKYDQLNDTIIRRFFYIEPPQFSVLSATYAPLTSREHPPTDDPNELIRLIRDSRFHPEQFADQADLPASLVAAKLELLSNIPEHGMRRDWHARMTQVNGQLAGRLAAVRNDLAERLEQSVRRMADSRRVASREFSFCIYPLESMARSLQQLTLSPSLPSPESPFYS